MDANLSAVQVDALRRMRDLPNERTQDLRVSSRNGGFAVAHRTAESLDRLGLATITPSTITSRPMWSRRVSITQAGCQVLREHDAKAGAA